MQKRIIFYLSIFLFLLTSCQKEIPVVGVAINCSKLELAEGETFTLEASVQPADASNTTILWESSAPEIAVVENGKVTAVKKGDAEIIAKSFDGSKSASCSVHVTRNNSFIYPHANNQ